MQQVAHTRIGDWPRSRFAGAFDSFVERIAPCPFATLSASQVRRDEREAQRVPLYTPQERARRDATVWTLVQGVLAPIQFLVFLASAGLVLRFLATGAGYELAAGSVVVKTMLLYAIMITGSIWEREVFGKYLFAPAFFWEDAVSMLVLALHTAYLAALAFGWGSADQTMLLALAAYAAYAVNAAQFVLKLRSARVDMAV
jgi:3-vinyl bacteriochlorophyllide hydratase